jgi:hypothetical protein
MIDKKASDKTFDIVLKSDYWNENGERIFAGTALNVSKETAITLITEQKAERSNEDLK